MFLITKFNIVSACIMNDCIFGTNIKIFIKLNLMYLIMILIFETRDYNN